MTTKYSAAVIERAKKIKMVLTDVDGVLTDASMNFFTTPEGELVEIKKFCAYDGIAFHMLRDFNIITGIITGGNAPATEFRAKSLGMDFLYYNFLSKLPPLQDIMERTGIAADEIAYIGDDLIDIPALKEVGLACSVSTARPEVQDIAHYITNCSAGAGVFREVAELVLQAQGHWDAVLKHADNGTIGESDRKEPILINYKTWKI